MLQFGPYLVERKLAQGGMAEVFLARDIGNARGDRVVVKRLLPPLAADFSFVEMFLDEAKVAVRLTHPSIAKVFAFGFERESYYLAMEYVHGVNLKALLEERSEKKQRVPFALAAKLVAKVAEALSYAHRARDEQGRPLNIIHRDVSPQNIMVSAQGDVKLIDFGIAKAATDTHQTMAGTWKGKYAYMSPEQLKQDVVDQRSDLYSLGLVMYELLTGRSAVPASEHLGTLMMSAALRVYTPVESLRPDTPKELLKILERALMVDPVERFQTATQFRDELEKWLNINGLSIAPKNIAALVTESSLMTTEPESPKTQEIPMKPEPGKTDLTILSAVSSEVGPLVSPVKRPRGPDVSLMPTDPDRKFPGVEAILKNEGWRLAHSDSESDGETTVGSVEGSVEDTVVHAPAVSPKEPPTATSNPRSNRWFLLGAAVIAIGFVVAAGGFGRAALSWFTALFAR